MSQKTKTASTPATMSTRQPDPFLSLKAAIPVALVAVASFHIAYEYSAYSFLIAAYVFCLFRLTHAQTARQAFYFGLCIGLAVFGPQLKFFWDIFGPGAIALWAVLAFWLALFLALGRATLGRFGPVALGILAPFLWTGLEYFRSELYFLRFSWLNVGYAFANADELRHMATFGNYGIGFLLMASASYFYLIPRMTRKTRIATTILLAGTFLYPAFKNQKLPAAEKTLHVAGVQLEFPTDQRVKEALDQVIQKYPQTEMVVLSEYTFPSPVPDMIRDWCKKHRKYLVAGARNPVPPDQFYNTAYVIGTNGDVVFQQVKSVPIQFFKDGLPAPSQSVWNSPWGKLGFAICYDDSYTRVMDRLVRLGAQALILPTMDVADWGDQQHRQHARIVPMRAAEYHLPIFRLCSSGISEFANPAGVVKASAPFPGEGAILEATLDLPAKGRVPPDRFLALASVIVTAAIASWFATLAVMRWRYARKHVSQKPKSRSTK